MSSNLNEYYRYIKKDVFITDNLDTIKLLHRPERKMRQTFCFISSL